MPTIRVETRIAAPLQHCFDLARDIDFHVRSLAHTGEHAVEGTTTGLIEFGETVTWEGRHLGVRQRLTSRITAMEPPRHFRDEMTRGAFKSLCHDHIFEPEGDATLMIDEVKFEAPFGILGRVAEFTFLTRYLRRLIVERGEAIQAEAEATSRGCA